MIGETVNGFVEKVQGYFTEMREQEELFAESIRDKATRHFTEAQGHNLDESYSMPLELAEVYTFSLCDNN